MGKYLLGFIVITVLIFVAYINLKGRLVTIPATKDVAVSKTETSKVDKSDPKWLEKYCREEVTKLPEAPFANKGLDGGVHMLSIPPIYLKNKLPDLRRMLTESIRNQFITVGKNRQISQAKTPADQAMAEEGTMFGIFTLRSKPRV